jgi:hypothetical protein
MVCDKAHKVEGARNDALHSPLWGSRAIRFQASHCRSSSTTRSTKSHRMATSFGNGSPGTILTNWASPLRRWRWSGSQIFLTTCTSTARSPSDVTTDFEQNALTSIPNRTVKCRRPLRKRPGIHHNSLRRPRLRPAAKQVRLPPEPGAERQCHHRDRHHCRQRMPDQNG